MTTELYNNKTIFPSYLCELPFEKKYNFLNKNTSFVDNLSLEEVKCITFDMNKNTYILTNNGDLFINGIKEYEEVKDIWAYDIIGIYAITNSNCIHLISRYKYSEKLGTFINNNDCKYKKIIYKDDGLVALTDDKLIRCIILDNLVGIDSSHLSNVDDITIIDERFYIVQNNRLKTLFITDLC